MKLQSLHLQSNKVLDQYKFYENLGFTFQIEASKALILQCGASTVRFHPSIKPSHYHFALSVNGDQMEELLEKLKEYTDVLTINEQEIVDHPHFNARSIYFKDPGNNLVEFIARPDQEEQEEVSHFLNGIEVYNACEIGIPVRNLESFQFQIGIRAQLEEYWSGEHCKCYGDTEGMLIVVDRHEVQWEITGESIEEYPCRILFNNGIRDYILSFRTNKWNLQPVEAGLYTT